MPNPPTFTSLQEELDFYKRLISELPIDINYTDSILNKSFVKKANEQDSKIKKVDKHLKELIDLRFFSDEEEFAQLELFLQPLFDLVPHHIVIINKAGNVTLCNKQVLIDFKTSLKEVLDQPIKQLLNLENNEIKLLETLRTEKELINEEILDSNYGIINTRLIRDRSGHVIRVIGVFHFLNESKEAEKMRMIGQISASIAHEIRNPLTTVRGYLQLLSKEEQSKTTDLFKDLLIPELDRANKIISEFLTVSKHNPIEKKPKKVVEFFSHFKDLMFSEAMIQDVDFQITYHPNVFNTLLLIDHNELIQVFVNLFNNSVDSKQKTHLTITVECDRSGDDLVILFKDNGVGIPQESLHYIFEPFYSTKETGTGLGLSLSKKIIELHNGTISVSSSPNEGTCFTIKLPIYQ
ncbi:two-component system sensor histidine kinase NtrB [Halalkalibacter akibai]|uniref:histidine kinase n=1 Tax=Halalkalibacter akibai (strain ATCC 43226 / DSM 21942 / CIP 109018 / JCM 9157 / 1139) TaxID=1236973 RepID=W4QQX8_HALA3|nr:ATP-binding protein [Halalkalibacter akibai]GAE34476.1 hypothetical protein JCM9157_1536 [Halalkalibacter akibai JCM 9157]